MRLISIVAIACALVPPCLCQGAESACDADADGGDDRCQLLQGAVGVVARHAVGGDEDETEHLDQEKMPAADDEEGWPDILKKINDAFGEVHSFENDFKAIKVGAKSFADKSQDAIKVLVDGVRPSMTLSQILNRVEEAYHKIHVAAEKFAAIFRKTASDFLVGLGKILPPKFKSVMNTTLQEVTVESHQFSALLEEGERDIQKVQGRNVTMICEKVAHGLRLLQRKASEFAAKALGLSAEKLKKNIEDMLPDAIKNKIEELVKDANDAVDHLKGSLGTFVKDFRDAVAQALKGHCSGLESTAPRLRIGLLTASVLGASLMSV